MKDKFIKFVKVNPSLIDYVKKNNISWQDLYEVYTLYGEDEKIWSKYISNNYQSLDDLLKIIKSINLDGVKKTAESLQKIVEILQGLSNNDKYEEPYEKLDKYEDSDD